MFLIENLSFSKEDKQRKGLSPKVEIPSHLKSYLDCLRDADRLEAIGDVGLLRCIEFCKAKGK